jgi:TatD DNase family protein
VKLIDTHCHLDFADFDADRSALLAAMAAKGVIAAIVPGVSANHWQNVLALAAAHPNIYPALGIHPCFIDQSQPDDLNRLEALIDKQQKKLVAIGECGLDFVVAQTDEQRQLQLVYFNAQLVLAKQFKLPVIIHHRKSHDIILRQLRAHKLPKGGVVHAFSGSYQQAKQYLDLGFKLGVGGTVTYERAIKTRDVIAKVPLAGLVLETDAPDMPIYGRQGARNSPEFINEIFTVLTQLRDEPASDIEAQLLNNTREVFGLQV